MLDSLAACYTLFSTSRTSDYALVTLQVRKHDGLSRERSAVNNHIGPMKTKQITTVVCILAFLLSTATPACATSDTDATSVVVDAVFARPVSFALTLLGSVVFVVSLPVAVPSGSVGKAAQTLVVTPAKDTFTRPLGDFDGFLDY